MTLNLQNFVFWTVPYLRSKAGVLGRFKSPFLKKKCCRLMLFPLFCISRSVSGVDVDPDLVHMEMQDTSGGTVMLHLLIYH